MVDQVLKDEIGDADRLLEMAVKQVEVYKYSQPVYLVGQVDLMEIAIAHGAKFSATNIFMGTYCLPSLEAASLMLKDPRNSLAREDYLEFILGASCKKYDDEKQAMVINSEQVELKGELIRLGFAKDVDLEKVYFISTLPCNNDVNIDFANKEGKTFLMLAAEEDVFGLAKFIVYVGADLGKKDKYGKTASMLAEEHGHIKIVELLKEKQDHENEL